VDSLELVQRPLPSETLRTDEVRLAGKAPTRRAIDRTASLERAAASKDR
jgi:hypothetical protein